MESHTRDLMDELPQAGGKNFRLRGKKYMLTYKWHIEKEWIKAFINTIHPVRYCFVAHESGHDDKTPYNHSHVLVEFREPISKQGKDACRIFDIPADYMNMMVPNKDGNLVYRFTLLDPPITQEDSALGCVHPNICIINTEKHWRNSLRYLGKEDTDCDQEIRAVFSDLEGKDSVFVRLSEMRTTTDLLKGVTSFSEVPGAIAAFNLFQRTREITPPTLKYSWQKQFLEEIEKRNPHLFNKRSIVWIYDPIGGSGKSDLTSYLSLMMPEKFLIIDQTGRNSDFAEIAKVGLNNGWTGEGLILDLPRDACQKQFYAPLESYKNNRITCTKYSGATYHLSKDGYTDTGNICIVMANFWPQIYNRVSIDRWRLFEITKESEDYHMHETNVHDVAKLQTGAVHQSPHGTVDAEVYGFHFHNTNAAFQAAIKENETRNFIEGGVPSPQ